MIIINKKDNSFKFFIKFMLKNKMLLSLIFVLNILSMIFNIVEPLLAKQILDISLTLQTLQDLIIPSLCWFCIFCIRYLTVYISKKNILNYNLNIYKEIRQFIFADILKKPLSFFQKNSPAYILSRCNNDISNLEGMMLSNLITGFLSILQILIIIILMIKINMILTFIVILLECIILYIQFAFPLKKIYREHNEALANMDKKVQDIFNCIKMVKSANNNKKEEQYYQNILKRYLEKRYKKDNFNIIRMIVTGFSMNFIYPAIVITGGVFIYFNLITVGAIMAFIMYFQKINALFNEAFSFIPLYKIAKVSADRLYEIISVKNENIETDIIKEKININQVIVINKINFSYNNKKILNDFSMKIYPNKVNVLIGVSGVGKSTLVNLLMGFIKADSGTIYINNKDISNYRVSDIRNSIALLSQESILLQRTVRENILYETNDILTDDEKISVILGKAKAEEFIIKLPNKLDYMLTDNGNNFSGGERQRLCLARELLKDAEVYIFDEATSALDIETERIILQTIKELAKTKTVIMITHKLENTKIADIINVMDNGKICESGSYDELINKKGSFFNLLQMNKKENGLVL